MNSKVERLENELKALRDEIHSHAHDMYLHVDSVTKKQIRNMKDYISNLHSYIKKMQRYLMFMNYYVIKLKNEDADKSILKKISVTMSNHLREMNEELKNINQQQKHNTIIEIRSRANKLTEKNKKNQISMNKQLADHGKRIRNYNDELKKSFAKTG